MKKILTLLTLFSFTSIQVGAIHELPLLAQCGYHPPQPQTENLLRSSIIVPSGLKKDRNIKNLASVSKKQAREIALLKYDGKVRSASLEIKDNTLVWKLEVKGKEGQKELFIDPQNGNFLGYGLTK